MSPCEQLSGLVRSELNHIFTERPFGTPYGPDFGWFCREHALCTAMFLRALGHPAEICKGDVIVQIPNRSVLMATVGSGADHAWCMSGNTLIDTSLTLKFIDPQSELNLACSGGTEYLNGFEFQALTNIPDDQFKRLMMVQDKFIAYNEKDRLTDIDGLLNDPFQFLHLPLPGSPRYTDIYGPDVFFAITAHLIKVLNGEAKPLFNLRSPDGSVRAMVNWNPNARSEIGNLIRGSAA